LGWRVEVHCGTVRISHILYNGFVCMNQVVDGLVAEYEMAATGSFKWQKLVKFLQKR
jgi:hypothetical protein